MELPVPNLNDVLKTISRLRTAVEKLRRRESGMIEAEPGEFPHRVHLKNFRSTDEVVVVTSGWWDDGEVHALVLKTIVEWDGERHVLTLTPADAAGGAMDGSAIVCVSWIAMA